MLYLNLLQLSFWFGLFYSSLPLPRTLGASLLDLSLNATPIDGPDRPPDLTVCVDDTHHPTWGLPPDGFDFSTCRQAVELIATRIEDKLYTSYEFYSRQVYPHGPMNPSSDAWPLAQGASAGESKACADEEKKKEKRGPNMLPDHLRSRMCPRDTDDPRLRQRRLTHLQRPLRPDASGQANPNQQLAIHPSRNRKPASDLRAKPGATGLVNGHQEHRRRILATDERDQR